MSARIIPGTKLRSQFLFMQVRMKPCTGKDLNLCKDGRDTHFFLKNEVFL